MTTNSEFLFSGGGGAAEYQIERSVRFNSADSAYLSRTPSVAGNRKTWTWSGWVKRSGLGAAYKMIFSAGSVSTECSLRFTNSPADAIEFYQYTGGGFNWQLTTTQVFRDPSSWYHIVAVVDSTQATTSERVKLYVNGTQVTAFGTTSYPSASFDSLVNSTIEHGIGRVSASQYFDGYLADVHLIDGQALDPTSFGEFDTNGVWQPKAYTGTYGTNGFHLPFSDNSTAAALGTDTSGNGNDWTTNNLSVAAGAGNDSLVDTPTNYGTDTGVGGEVRGNYCTLNPLSNGGLTLFNGNLDYAPINPTWTIVLATFGMSSGKWYWEQTYTSGNANCMAGIGNANSTLGSYPTSPNSTGYNFVDGYIYGSGAGAGINGATLSAGDTMGIAVDVDAGTAKFYKNGSLQLTLTHGITGTLFPLVSSYDGIGCVNFGQRPFAYAAPTGYKALCTQNLPTETITTSGTFTGNGAADGPFVYLNGVPTAMTINGNSVTFGTHADKLSNGFKVRTNSTSYNAIGSNTYSISTTGSPFKTAKAQPNP